MNLYLPDALKAEMERCEGVNWSQVAQSAFRHAIEVAELKTVNPNQAGIERLRASRETKMECRQAAAAAAGKTWALEHAEYDQLKRVAELETDTICGEPGGAYGWGAVVVEAVDGNGLALREEIEAFCEQHLGVAYPDAEQVVGFIEGAAEVLAQVD